jgi:uncharacterized membrane protein required for colicin V production
VLCPLVPIFCSFQALLIHCKILMETIFFSTQFSGYGLLDQTVSFMFHFLNSLASALPSEKS